MVNEGEAMDLKNGDADSDSLSRRKWTDKEDAYLKMAVERHEAKNWKSIAEEVPGRNHVQCLQRWKKVLKPGLKKGHWTAEEDEMLRQVVTKGYKNWGDVASKIEGRTAKQCRERWSCNLDPNICREKWSKNEDELITHWQSVLGNRWSKIAKKLPGRTENAIKTRAKSLQRAKLKEWSPEEDRIIYESKALAPTPNTRASAWAKIAEKLPNRSKNAVKRRWKELRGAGYDGVTQPPSLASKRPKEETDMHLSDQTNQESKMNQVRNPAGANIGLGQTHHINKAARVEQPHQQLPLGGMQSHPIPSDLSEGASSMSSSCNSTISPFHSQMNGFRQENFNVQNFPGAQPKALPFQQPMFKAETPPYQQANLLNPQFHASPQNFMHLANQSPLNATMATTATGNSPFNNFTRNHMATSTNSQLSHFPSVPSNISLSPGLFMPGYSGSPMNQASPFMNNVPPPAAPAPQNFYGATPPVIIHREESYDVNMSDD